MAIIGLIGMDGINDEELALRAAATRRGDVVVSLNPKEMRYGFIFGNDMPLVYDTFNELPHIDVLFVGSTVGSEVETTLLVKTLILRGTRSVDPKSRFPSGSASKLSTTVSRFEQRLGSTSFVAWTADAMFAILSLHQIDWDYPLITKPMDGAHGDGVFVLRDESALRQWVHRETASPSVTRFPYLFQQFHSFSAEYRVVLINGSVLYTARKHLAEGGVAGNTAQGATWQLAPHDEEPAKFAQSACSPIGLIGADVAKDEVGRWHLLEANRAPQWAKFDNNFRAMVADRMLESVFSD